MQRSIIGSIDCGFAYFKRRMRAVLAVLTLLLGLIVPAHTGPPLIAPAVEVQAPDLQPAPVVQVYLIAYRAHGPPAVLLAVRATSSRSAWCIQYAYCGGDSVNRWDPSGLFAVRITQGAGGGRPIDIP